MVKSKPNMKKNGNNNEISDEVSVLLVIYWNDRKRTPVIG